jgi:hypothetical protein
MNSISTGWSAPISVALAIDVLVRGEADDHRRPEHDIGYEDDLQQRKADATTGRYATATITGAAIHSRQNTMVGAAASIPRTSRGPKPHANNATAPIEIATRARPSRSSRLLIGGSQVDPKHQDTLFDRCRCIADDREIHEIRLRLLDEPLALFAGDRRKRAALHSRSTLAKSGEHRLDVQTVSHV